MLDIYYLTEYDNLLNALFSYSHEYNNQYPTACPKIYFDAIDVIFRQLVSVCEKFKNTDVENNIFDCMYIYSSFAKEAIENGNSNGATLATIYLKERYEYLHKGVFKESAEKAIKLLVDIGG